MNGARAALTQTQNEKTLKAVATAEQNLAWLHKKAGGRPRLSPRSDSAASRRCRLKRDHAEHA